MKYLLDTHALIWLVESPERFPAKVDKILKKADSADIAISSITPWEIAKKVSLGKLSLICPVSEWLASATDKSGITLLPMGVDIAVESNQLPGDFHNDPADQIIVATARIHKLTLISVDKKIMEYQHVRTFWE